MNAAPAWAAPFIGAPYSDHGDEPGTYNCWTLFVAARKAGFGLDTQGYDGPVWAGRQGVAAMAEAAEAFAARFQLIASGAEWRAGKRAEQPGDAVLLRLAGHPIHIGLVVAPGLMLHIDRDVEACIERYTGALWRSRVEAFYREGS